MPMQYRYNFIISENKFLATYITISMKKNNLQVIEFNLQFIIYNISTYLLN